jgi:molybdate transport system permease protein
MLRRDRPSPPPPWPIVVLGLLAIAFFALPFVGLLVRAPWSAFGDVASDSGARTALWLSLVTSLLTTVLAIVLGVPLAWLLARSSIPGRRWVRALCTLSMVLPPVVAGVALFLALGRRGLVGRPIDEVFGVSLPFTTAAVVVAQLFVAMPFLVLTVDAALRGLEPGREEAARTLGASPWYVFRRVTLPSVKPALVSGIVLTWARALGEFGATITFAGSFPGSTRTMPIATYLALETDPDQAVLLSLVLVAVSFAVLIGLRDRWVGATFGGGAA